MNNGSTTLDILLQCAAAEMTTVPGERTSPSGYFCFMERESFPVGTLIPKSMAKSETPLTASYKRASSPGFLQGHIQFADKETLLNSSSKGAQTILVNASVMAFLLPALGSISAAMGACPILVATP